MSDTHKKFPDYAQDGIEPLKSMMPQLGLRGTPSLSSAMPKAAPAPTTAPTPKSSNSST